MNYLNKTIPELKAICKERNIKGISKKNKKTLIELIQQKETEPNVTQKNNTEVNMDIIINTTVKVEQHEDTYTKELLKEQYALHKLYVTTRKDTTKKIGVKVRLPSIPEDISENIVKQIIHNKLNDKTSTWDHKKGDLFSQKEGRQECKCFTSDGPISFTPSSEWDIIYFLDARSWLNDKFILYRIPLKRTSNEWINIKVNKTQTFLDQSLQGRRPRLNWVSLKPQIEMYCSKVFEGTFDEIFTLSEATE
jgi:hypothetical protein